MNFALQDRVARAELARQVFRAALAAADPASAVRRAVTTDGDAIEIAGVTITSSMMTRKVFAVALGKAADALARGLSQTLGPSLTGGIIVGPRPVKSPSGLHDNPQYAVIDPDLPRWTRWEGGHPFPTAESFRAGRAVIDFVRAADALDAAIVFLISGGGSALVEWPIDERVTVADLTKLNFLLTTSGAPIREINIVRQCFSAIKGGGLARFAPRSAKVALVVSDTNPGDEGSVASGPAFRPIAPETMAREILRQYGLLDRIPRLLRQLVETQAVSAPANAQEIPVPHQVILQNADALAGASAEALRLGFEVEIADDIREQEISAGCRMLVSRLRNLDWSRRSSRPLCLLSGGEFACRVTGDGRGGRNTETALRIAITPSELNSAEDHPYTFISAGTDGIDGNSPAAGAIADESTLARARSLGLDAHAYLARNDSFTFFDRLDDTLITGATGTNVRDLRALFSIPCG